MANVFKLPEIVEHILSFMQDQHIQGLRGVSRLLKTIIDERYRHCLLFGNVRIVDSADLAKYWLTDMPIKRIGEGYYYIGYDIMSFDDKSFIRQSDYPIVCGRVFGGKLPIFGNGKVIMADLVTGDEAELAVLPPNESLDDLSNVAVINSDLTTIFVRIVNDTTDVTVFCVCNGKVDSFTSCGDNTYKNGVVLDGEIVMNDPVQKELISFNETGGGYAKGFISSCGRCVLMPQEYRIDGKLVNAQIPAVFFDNITSYHVYLVGRFILLVGSPDAVASYVYIHDIHRNTGKVIQLGTFREYVDSIMRDGVLRILFRRCDKLEVVEIC